MNAGSAFGAVGDKLVELAIDDHAHVPVDAYVRSAFNRYYYASFLVVQYTLGEIDNRWARTPHRDIPCRLRKDLFAKAKRIIRRNIDSFPPNSANELLTVLRSAGGALADDMKEAYEIRRIADYEPDVDIRRQGWEASIDGVALRDAQKWHPQAVERTMEIRRAWREISPD
jgi:hypothetical protein